MAGFDKSLDKQIYSESVEFETSKLTVGVFSYNDGTPKVQISKEVLDPNTGEYKWAKVGRLFKEEVEAITPLLQKAVEKM